VVKLKKFTQIDYYLSSNFINDFFSLIVFFEK